jgi:hypothetical protein
MGIDALFLQSLRRIQGLSGKSKPGENVCETKRCSGVHGPMIDRRVAVQAIQQVLTSEQGRKESSQGTQATAGQQIGSTLACEEVWGSIPSYRAISKFFLQIKTTYLGQQEVRNFEDCVKKQVNLTRSPEGEKPQESEHLI